MQDFRLCQRYSSPVTLEDMHTSNSPVPLTAQECWALLRTVDTCRVAYSDRALPAIASLPFTADGSRIVLMSPEGTGQHAAMVGAVIAFQAEHADALEPAWSITCIGKPYPIRMTVDGPAVLAFDPELLDGRRLAVLPVTTPEGVIPAVAPAM